jgi:BirA family biotin operon repressor/biotin-[acetyl-CoA-carboxylase] ligase
MVIKKYYFKKIKSTNDQAIKMIKRGYNKGIIITEEQTDGRGQYGNKWISLKGNLFMTIFFEINKKRKISEFTKFNLKIIKRVIQKYIKKKLTIKPPNDILVNEKKICGILQEVIFFKLKKLMIVGIGINIKKSPKINKYKTTFLNEHTINKIDKISVIKNLQKIFEKNIRFYKCI